MITVSVVVLVMLVVVVIYFVSLKKPSGLKINDNNSANSPSSSMTQEFILKDGRQCYGYNHDATSTEPYAVNERIDMKIKGSVVTGTKTGTQSGPDMTNGYTGTLVGTTDRSIIHVAYSYTVEGSHNVEQEIYRARPDQIGIEKMRYPLIEQKGGLVPDTTKPFSVMLYTRAECDASN